MMSKRMSGLLALVLSLGMIGIDVAPALALGELPINTPAPDISTPTPLPTELATPTPVLTTPTPIATATPSLSTPLPSILPSDSTPPVIADVAELSLLPTEATIVWSTDELAVSTFAYGTTTSYNSSPTISASALLVHTATLLGLTPGTKYYYCIHATDLSQNVASSCNHFFTTATAATVLDTNPPTISVVALTEITATSVTAHWLTSEVANADVVYGTTPSYTSVSQLDPSLELSHAITLMGLAPGTEYHYQVRSSDESRNESVSPDETFTTATVNATPLPSSTPSVSIAVVSGVETVQTTDTTATVHWNTDIPSTTQVQYGDNELLGQTTPLDATLTMSHAVTISSLVPNTSYFFRVPTASHLYTFNTLSQNTPAVTPANIVSVSASVTDSPHATVSVTTDEATTAQVQYGLTTEYGPWSNADSSQTAHTLMLADLTPGTTYQYRVKVTDSDGNITYSENRTFTTQAPTVPVAAPTAVTNLAISSKDSSSATLMWNVSSAGVDAAVQYDIRYSLQPITEQNFAGSTTDQAGYIGSVDLAPQGTTRTYIVAGLTPGATYYFAVKSRFENTSWSALSNTLSATLSARLQLSPAANTNPGIGSGGGSSGPVSAPLVLTAAGADGQIVFNWKNPNEMSFVRTIIVRKTGSYPTSPGDGQVVYEGNQETFTDTNLVNGTTHYYAVYAYDRAKNYSDGIRVSLAPVAKKMQVIFALTPQMVPNGSVDHFVQTFKRGDTNIEIEHLQEILSTDEGLYSGKLISSYFNAATQSALKRFQAKYHLPQTGITDAATRAILNNISASSVKLSVPGTFALFGKDLRYGNSNKDVASLQQFLTYEGSYQAGVIDGIFGISTFNAVKTFQKKYEIQPVSGYFGPKTRHKIRQISGL